jgi:hypothetical protein
VSKLEACFDRCVSASTRGLGKGDVFDVIVEVLSIPIICALNCYRKEARLPKKALNVVVQCLSFT